MKVISLWQPWAQLIVEGKKYDETRSWKTNYRGEILIHASKKPIFDGISLMGSNEMDYLKQALELPDDCMRWRNRMPCGAIIGKAKLVDCKLIDTEYREFVQTFCPAEFAFGDFSVGRYAWVMQDAVKFEQPIPVKGRQGIWNWEGKI